jgi:tetratricopeptide (TPR) repeat protein
MINARELEKRWYKYKTKGVLLILSIVTILSLLIYGGYYILYKLDITTDKNKSIQNQPKKEMIISPKKTEEKIKEKNSSIEVTATKAVEKDNSVMLSPTIPVIDLEKEKLKDSRRVVEYNLAKAKKRRRAKHYVKVKQKKLVKAKASTYLTANELAVVNGKNIKKEKKKIAIKKSSNNYMNIMKQKFQQSKNPRDAILIAKAYYNAGNYKKAEEWSLIANSLNKNLDESWLLFAKSKEKMGKKKEALKILVTYYNKSKSSKVKALIEKMRSESI